jgi:uncharacterized protein (DUF433 family)
MKERMHFSEADPLVLDPHGTVRLKGSRVTLVTLIANFKKGYKPKQLQEAFSTLTLEQINGAIEWYRSHRREAEAHFKEYYAEGERLRKEIESQPGYQARREELRRRIKQLNKT